MISTQVEQIIVQLKEKPNGIYRNKSMSQAHELFASLTMMELEIYPNDNSKKLAGDYDGSKEIEQQNKMGAPDFKIAAERDTGCICPPGSVRFNCPVHQVI